MIKIEVKIKKSKIKPRGAKKVFSPKVLTLKFNNVQRKTLRIQSKDLHNSTLQNPHPTAHCQIIN
jgi:hypothetical protein